VTDKPGVPNPDIFVFDLGGVLCEFSPERRWAALGAASGLPADEVRRRIDDAGLIDLADRGKLTRDEEFQRATSSLGLTCDYPTYRALWCAAFRCDPGVIEIARALHARHRTVLLTNNGPVLLDALSQDLRVVGREFDRLLVSAMFGATKPADVIYRGVERELVVEPARLCLIDDSWANVDGARRSGWRGMQFMSATLLREELATFLEAEDG
jgi:HAD superfamily hydrolase (TIGR01509 family)